MELGLFMLDFNLLGICGLQDLLEVLEAVATYTSAYKYKLFNKNIYLIIKYIFYYILIIFIKYILIYNLNYNYIYSSSTSIRV